MKEDLFSIDEEKDYSFSYLMTKEKWEVFVHFTRKLLSALSSLRDGSKAAKSLMVLGLVFMNSSKSSNPKRKM